MPFYDKQTRIHPVSITPDPNRETDTAPLNRWDCDILEDEGAWRLQNIIVEIKTKCSQLKWHASWFVQFETCNMQLQTDIPLEPDDTLQSRALQWLHEQPADRQMKQTTLISNYVVLRSFRVGQISNITSITKSRDTIVKL